MIGDERTETRTIRWRAVEGPRRCVCGHEHYGWITDAGQSPQWGYCDRCPCSCLRPVRSVLADQGESSDA